jgi:hypothetical protein
MFQVGDLVEWALPLDEARRRPIGIITAVVHEGEAAREDAFTVEWCYMAPRGVAHSFEMGYCLRVASSVSEGE